MISASSIHICLLSLVATCTLATSEDLPLKLGVKIPLDSQSANIHISRPLDFPHPFTISYGGCLSAQHEAHHVISTVTDQNSDRLVWILAENIPTKGCLSAWSAQHGLVGRSEPLTVNKYSRSWKKKREVGHGPRLGKRASIPMSNASGIDAEGPWFDGVELLKQKEIGAVSVKEAKAKSMSDGKF